MRYEGYLFLKNEIVFREIPIIDVPRRIFNGIRCSIDFLSVLASPRPLIENVSFPALPFSSHASIR